VASTRREDRVGGGVGGRWRGKGAAAAPADADADADAPAAAVAEELPRVAASTTARVKAGGEMVLGTLRDA